MKTVALVVLSFIFMASCQTQYASQNDYPRFEIAAADDDFPVSVPTSFDATLGWLVVKEDRARRDGPDVRLPVAVIHAATDTGKSPIVYLSGGPGTSAMRTAAFPGAYPWLQDRDFIVVGQRGTHFATPALMCPEYRDAVAQADDPVAAATACKERLVDAGVGLHAYNSRASADDLDDLRTALGLETWSLYAGSYGTRLALVYAKRYGETIESMVLDSPLPPNAIYDDESAVNLETALRAVARDCADDRDCAAAFPELEARFFQTLDDVSATPIVRDGRGAAITAPALVSLVPMSSEAAIRRAPAAMDRVATLDPAALGELGGPRQASDFAWGMRFSVWCSEALPFSERRQGPRADPVLGGYESAAIDPDVCEVWDVPAVDPGFVDPVVSDVPTLIIAGEFDPLTPPVWGDLAAQTLTQSRVIVIRGGGHSSTQQWGGDGCAMSLAAAFFAAPGEFLAASPAACAAARERPDYQVAVD